ncbi:hypothetical protein SAMN05443665_10292 [Actinomadura meyerae]|jgi:hypothetical protein|uniref:Uncharacterized protein n=1 Tax=Actinomadura meyerae TaxID=240840 RepID=A0A239MJD0_9ACTN|nr:hypothetical protein SAMN05443665_10292 [Actinomadura meyerae]
MARFLHRALPIALALNVAPIVLVVCIHMTG